jgi:hypothetical protein
VLLWLVLAGSPVIDANAAGMKLYQAKKYPGAVAQFRLAVKNAEAVPQPTTKEQVAQTRALALAHFNLACTLSLLRRAKRVCEFDAYRSTITEHVGRSIALDPNRLEKALTDADLAGVRDTFFFQSLKGLSPKRVEQLDELVRGVRWWNAGQGVYGSTVELVFTGGQVEVTSLSSMQKGLRRPSPRA